jgi:hypothetical protein
MYDFLYDFNGDLLRLALYVVDYLDSDEFFDSDRPDFDVGAPCDCKACKMRASAVRRARLWGIKYPQYARYHSFLPYTHYPL